MAIESREMRSPRTRDLVDPTIPAEFQLAGDAAKPAATSDPNVFAVPGVDRQNEVEEFWQFKWRTDDPASDAVMILWFHDYWLDQWYPGAAIEVKGEAGLSPNHGGVYSMPGVLACDFVGIQMTGHAGKTLFLALEWS